MAQLSLRYAFADGDAIEVDVYVETGSYPDELDQARATAIRAFREALATSLDTLTRRDDT